MPYTPGAGSDTLMRLVARKVSESVKQPVIVDNRPGAGGTIAATVVKNAAPDGYTLLMGHSGTHVFNKVLFPGVGPDPVKDFEMVTPLMSFACVLVVPADSPAKSVSDLVAAAKSKTGGLSYASQGPGNTAHLLGEMFRASSKAPLVHVPYRGNAPAFNDLVAGRVDMMFSSYLSAGSLIEGKKLRILAFTASKRSGVIRRSRRWRSPVSPGSNSIPGSASWRRLERQSDCCEITCRIQQGGAKRRRQKAARPAGHGHSNRNPGGVCRRGSPATST